MQDTIALVDDDRNILTSVSIALEAEGFRVRTYNDGAEALRGIAANPVDLAVLDIKMPRMDGMELLGHLRKSSNLPIIFLTSKDDEIDEVLGLRMGADDYITKPFSQRLLIERIRALLRRGTTPTPTALRWGALSLQPDTYEVTYAGQALRLTPKEFSILELLMRNGRRVLSRSFMLNALWSMQSPPDEETVKAHIKSLRHKLRGAGSPKTLIETVHGLGYRLSQCEAE